jgi:hypothetical protein
MYVGVVVNPLARKNHGKPADRCAELGRIVGPWGEVHETGSVAELRAVVRRLVPRVSHLVSDGGDGSLHWLINETRSQVSDCRVPRLADQRPQGMRSLGRCIYCGRIEFAG